MFKNLKNQQGMTGFGWMFVIFLICFFALIGVKLSPAYVENYSIKSIIERVREEPNIAKKSAGEIRKMIKKHLVINGIRDIKNEHIVTKKFAGVLTVKIEYEVRRALFGNVDVVLMFKNEFEMETR